MDDLEITALPVSAPHDIVKLRTLGYTDEGDASQVPLANLITKTIKAASIDFLSGLYIAQEPFVAGTSEVFVTGLRYTSGKDYEELSDGKIADGFKLSGIESSDEIILKSVVTAH